MKIEKDDFDGLLREISYCKATGIASGTANAIKELLKEMGWDNAFKAVKQLTSRDSLPSNIYGALQGIYREIKTAAESEHLWKNSWKSDPDCTTPQEWAAFWGFMTELMLWHRLKLVQSNPNGVTTPADIITYKRAGMPKTWSPILDHFLEGFYSAWKGDFLEKYMIEYRDRLSGLRKQKMIDHSKGRE